MELDELKSDWKNLTPDTKTGDALFQMIQRNSHPVLKGIRRQLVIETALFTVFLLVYYSGFNGDQKPLYTNVLLVTAMLLVIGHNILGYLAAQNIVAGSDLKVSLENYLVKVRRYAIVSVSSRAAAFICLILFFSSTVTFSSGKLLVLLGMLLVIPVQVFFLSRIWKKRIGNLKAMLKQLVEK
ncbi:hypothetical protein [Salmonirosea aquatica]|uniref:Uncharacterized protein n=1 Tax=Salmonirosea aquatica TaxID=2654236 RepID=A0A7C9B998_9BACT|nr:hypothetical protein [Cytophagaceae bacterium SJW1-29]